MRDTTLSTVAELPRVRLAPSSKARLRSAHPWVYRDDLLDPGALPAGPVAVERSEGALHGVALYSPQSRIALRWLQVGIRPEEPFSLSVLLRERVLAAASRRASAAERSSMFRLVASEADGLPGIVVDRYAGVFVVQITTAGFEPLLPALVDVLREELGAEVVVERDEVKVRRLEGLELRSGVLHGAVDGPVETREGSLRCSVDVLAGQKTGAFLDQRENHLAFGAAVARRGDREVLDAFCHDGLFGLQAAAGGASSVCFLDQAGAALARVRENLARNPELAATRCEFREANAFDELRALRVAGASFDAIALDPPAFAKSRRELAGALRGYREINAQALRLLRPGGQLWTCSCSYNLLLADFEEVLRRAAADTGRRVWLREIRGQADDHPVLLTHPETRYLKVLVLEVI